MKTNKGFYILILINGLALLLSACSPAVPAQSEVFGSEPAVSLTAVSVTEPTAAPAPTEAGVPGPCAPAGGQPVFHSERDGYCFLVPAGFELETGASGQPLVDGLPVDDGVESPRLRLDVQVQSVHSEANLFGLVNSYLVQHENLDPPVEIGRSIVTLGGVEAEVLEDVPGRLSSRIVLALHNDRLYTITLFPSDVDELAADFESLYAVVVESFAFFTPEGEPAPPNRPGLFITEAFGRPISPSSRRPKGRSSRSDSLDLNCVIRPGRFTPTPSPAVNPFERSR